MELTVFTVTELNNHIKELLELDPMLAQVHVRGELSNYKIYPSGHHYFTLKDTQGSLRCVMFRSSAQRLRFRPENGMGVTVTGRVSVFPRDGTYQLYCNDISPEGFGDLFVAFEQLKARLAAEGLFDTAHKKPLPRYPRRIAVITSGAGAAVRDIIRVLGKRWPQAKVIVLPVRVQGAEAPPEIAGALRYANATRIADLIITGRGGGSIEDLWAFNDERVARAIYDSEIPVISAVGQEPDVTISDFVSDLRTATPSNAAELAVPDAAELREAIAGMQLRAAQAMRKKLLDLKNRLGDLKSRRVIESPAAYIDQKRMELDLIRGRLMHAAERTLSEKKHGFVRLAASLDALSPLKVLSRGYSIVMDGEGHVIKDAAALDPGDRIGVTLEKGRLQCIVEGREIGKAEL
jgi:exodeoxyribonuclease VII large subunit